MTQTVTSPSPLSPLRGFLPEQDPLQRLPEPFAALEEIAGALPKILMSDTPRRFIASLPPLPIEQLSGLAEINRAMMLLSYLGHGYVWSEKPAAAAIPASLAVPWHGVGKLLGRPPVLSYSSYSLCNWRRLDTAREVELGNIVLLQNFLAGVDEEWFVLIHVDIEMLAAPGLNALLPAQDAAARGESDLLSAKLAAIAQSLDQMNHSMERMPERCDPHIYYRRVRPYIHGWKNNPALPDGVVYEGVAEYHGKPQQFRGETGSQSSIVPALDAALGITHQEDQLAVFLREMRDYMPPEHRAFLEQLERAPNMREAIIKKMPGNSAVKDAYNACLEGINRFRRTHLGYASEYIDKQAESDLRNPTKVGTGGTPFMTYLAKHQQETAAQKIP